MKRLIVVLGILSMLSPLFAAQHFEVVNGYDTERFRLTNLKHEINNEPVEKAEDFFKDLCVKRVNELIKQGCTIIQFQADYSDFTFSILYEDNK